MNRKHALMIVLAFALMFGSFGMFSQVHANTTNPDRSLVPKSTGNMDPILDVTNPPGSATTPNVPNTPSDRTTPGARTFDQNMDRNQTDNLMQPRSTTNDNRMNDNFRTRNTTNNSNMNWSWLGLLGLIGLFGLTRRDRAVER